MKKQLFIFTVIATSVVGFANEAPKAGFKLAYVDLQKALQTVDAGKKAKAQLEKELTSKKGAIEAARAELQKEVEAHQKKAAIMNEAARGAAEAALQKKIAQMQQTEMKTQADLQGRERELTKPLIDELRVTIESIGKEKEFDLVAEKNEGAILYAKNGTDITEEVIEKFNAKHKGGVTESDKKKKK